MSFTVYRSSAGSGKTFILVKEYVRLILVDPGDFRHLLAITFTNKAANEMKERVLTALGELSKGDLSQDTMIRETLIPLLVAETGLTPHMITLNAARALEMILHNYADFAIGTIDSFSQRLIRTFAHDFGLPVNFSVELDADELLSTAVDLLLDRVGDDEALTGLLVKFLETRMDDDRGWDIGSILTRFAEILLDEEGQGRIGRLKSLSLEKFQAISGELHTRIRQFEKGVREIALEASGLLQRNGFSPADFYQGDRGIWGYFMNLATGKFDRMEPNSYVLATVDEDKWYSGKVTASARERIEAVRPRLIAIYRRLRAEIEQHRQDYFLRKLLAGTIYPLAVLNEIEKVLSDFKHQNNLVHISEFNARIAAIVMNEPVPFIYERLGEKFQHILIDEFQDTSALQWLNFIPLVENALAGGHFNLVVGDGKQAIYRWRGGDVEQFKALPAIPGSDGISILETREAVLKRHCTIKNLDRNFRSGSEIVAFNNRFFKVIADQVLTDGKKEIYEGLEQKINPQNTGGYISLEFLQGKGDDVDYEARTQNRILEIIQEAGREQFCLRDIAILCRSNKNATGIARFLLEHRVEVVSSESLLVSNSLKVRFLIACLKFLFEPRNDIVVAEIRKFIQQSGIATGNGLEQARDEFSMLPVYDLCEALIRHFKLNVNADPYLRFFLDAVLKFTVRISTGAMEFLEWWEKNSGKLSIVVPEQLNAVKVMTIHKAKGLEFPLVILPFAQETRKNTKPYLWVDLDPDVAPGLETAILRSEKDMESTVYRPSFTNERQKSMLDLVNLLYVAMTRAEERLYILTKFPPRDQLEISSLPGFFRLFLQHQDLWADNQSQYEFGMKTDHIATAGEHDTGTVTHTGMISNDWREKIRIRRSAPASWDAEDMARKTQWGNMIHTILSWIVTGEDVPDALVKASLSGLMDHSDRAEVEKILWSVIRDPLLERLFSGQVRVKTEAEILLPEGSFYRPDRVVFDGSRVIILDFKTGKQRAEHAEQLVKYASHINDMGYENIQRLLVYLDPEVMVAEV